MPLQTWVTNQVLTSTDMNIVGRQSIAVVTSVTRPASPVEGQTIYETDTDKFVVWDGAAWQEVLQAGAWTTFTPTISQVSARTTSTNSFAYARVGGKCVEFSGAITITNAGTADERNPTIVLTGPLLNTVITNVTNGCVLTYTGTIASPRVVTISKSSTGEYTATNDLGANVIGNVTHSGDAALFVVDAGDNDLSVADGTHTTGSVKVEFYPPYL